MKITNISTKESLETTIPVDVQMLDTIARCSSTEEEKFNLLVKHGKCIDKNEMRSAVEAGELRTYGGTWDFLTGKMEAAGWFAPVVAWQDEPATEKQIYYMQKLGIENIPANLTKGEASKLIDAAKNAII